MQMDTWIFKKKKKKKLLMRLDISVIYTITNALMYFRYDGRKIIFVKKNYFYQNAYI